jgi:hypothetical protein
MKTINNTQFHQLWKALGSVITFSTRWDSYWAYRINGDARPFLLGCDGWYHQKGHTWVNPSFQSFCDKPLNPHIVGYTVIHVYICTPRSRSPFLSGHHLWQYDNLSLSGLSIHVIVFFYGWKVRKNPGRLKLEPSLQPRGSPRLSRMPKRTPSPRTPPLVRLPADIGQAAGLVPDLT